jgi:GTPase SAR1 family protein
MPPDGAGPLTAAQELENIESGNDTVQQDLFAETDLARTARTRNRHINNLGRCGMDEQRTLPKIVFVGNQSSGKSSLIEAISQVKVPRSSGTCTRCPMQVSLFQSEEQPWTCKVSLKFERNVDAGREFKVVEFKTTHNREEVEDILSLAQIAILNPTRDPAEFRDINLVSFEKSATQAKFSEDTVLVEIVGAAVDVTFIDLPGIISSTESVRQTAVTVLITRPRTLIGFSGSKIW